MDRNNKLFSFFYRNKKKKWSQNRINNKLKRGLIPCLYTHTQQCYYLPKVIAKKRKKNFLSGYYYYGCC